MNDSQNKKYWRRWAEVCRVNHWRTVKGRLVDEAVQDASPHHSLVWRWAKSLADQACRAVTADDLRHGCHVHAFDRDVSHTEFTNGQFSRLLLLWGDERAIRGLLIYTDDVKAQTLWDHPEIAEKEALVRAIRAAAPEKYIETITSDIWATIFWEDLDNDALRGLLRKLKGTRPTFPR